ncbi:MAG: LysR family transcriptional regulator [Myxococcaceae bacterium]|jgi:DNA-binding transcriptional LysR family regulator|nr:LysR family transcriptional regulator [Myxococcaceae bacterium]MCA3013956.1 LysR family transcriptional regulator [Myxococcaceae bacterium]
MDLDLNLLETFDALLQEGSVSRAAKRVGLSTPAMSHALARLRATLGDEVLVRAGRDMVPTPRALALKEDVHTALARVRALLRPPEALDLRALTREFRVNATDHVVTVLGAALDTLARREAPGVLLRFLPTATDDAALLRDGSVDLAVGIYADLPPELRRRVLLTDRFVSVLRRGHPAAKGRLDLDTFLALDHLQVAPRGRPGGDLDDLLAARGKRRRVTRAVPYFLSALQLVSESDAVLTISERMARRLAGTFGLVVLETPLPLRPYALSLLWHPRQDSSPEHSWLRQLFVRAAELAAPGLHPGAKTRTGPSPSSRRGRRAVAAAELA